MGFWDSSWVWVSWVFRIFRIYIVCGCYGLHVRLGFLFLIYTDRRNMGLSVFRVFQNGGDFFSGFL